jgi:hypothetical protein
MSKAEAVRKDLAAWCKKEKDGKLDEGWIKDVEFDVDTFAVMFEADLELTEEYSMVSIILPDTYPKGWFLVFLFIL